jgi:type IV secretion system protein VirB3
MASENNARLQADPLFQGLARPPMVMGVSYMYFLVNGMCSLFAFIWTSNFLVLFVVGPLVHAIGYLICMNEPRAIELLVLRMSKGMRCINRAFHQHTNSYDIF